MYALAAETCMSTFAFYHKFWHKYMLIFTRTNTILLSLILFRKKLPMRDMNQRYFYVWLNVITYCMATDNTLQCCCSYNHIFSVLQEQSILTFYKRSLYPFLKLVFIVKGLVIDTLSCVLCSASCNSVLCSVLCISFIQELSAWKKNDSVNCSYQLQFVSTCTMMCWRPQTDFILNVNVNMLI